MALGGHGFDYRVARLVFDKNDAQRVDGDCGGGAGKLMFNSEN